MEAKAKYGMDVYVTDGVHEFYGKVSEVDFLGRFTVVMIGRGMSKPLERKFHSDGFLIKRRGRGSLSKLRASLIF